MTTVPKLIHLDRLAACAIAGAILVAAGACRQSQPAPQADAPAAPIAAAPPAEAPEVQQRLDEARAAEAAAAAAAEQALAEREALLEAREGQLRRAEALRSQQAQLAAKEAEIRKREQELAVRAKELENYEANLTFQERELRDREAAAESLPEDPQLEPASAPEDGELAGDAGGSGWLPENDAAESPRAAAPPAERVKASLQPGRMFEIEILETLTSRTSRLGDTVSARLLQDLRAEDGTLVVPAGAEVLGRVTEVTPLKSVGGQASLEVEFTHIVLSATETIAISASFVELGANKRGDKKKIAGAAIVGAILGRVLGGDTSGAVAGAAVGAAAGTAVAARAKGKDAEIPAGETVALQLDEVVTVTVEMKGPAND